MYLYLISLLFLISLSSCKYFGNSDTKPLSFTNYNNTVMQSDQPWMIITYHQWCEMCAKNETLWNHVTKALKGKVRFGAVDYLEQSILNSFFISKYIPTIYALTARNKSYAPVELIYKGKFDFSDITEFGEKLASENAPPIPVAQMTSSSAMKTSCLKNTLCLIAFLPTLDHCDAVCRNAHLRVLGEIGLKYNTRKWGIMWSEIGSQPTIDKAFKVTSLTVVALVARRSAFLTMPGEVLSTETLDAFITQIDSPEQKLEKIKLPKVKSIDGWISPVLETSKDEL